MSAPLTDGYVKYTAAHTMSPVIESPHWAELNDARTYLHQLGLVGAVREVGYFSDTAGVGFGNVSIRYKENSFLISGTATGAKPELTPGEYSLVCSCDIAYNRVVTTGPVQASSESMTHGAVYESCPGANCVMHIHCRAVFDGMLRDGYSATPESAGYGTPEIALAIAKCVKEINNDEGIIVLSGHDEGVIAYGPSVKKTLNIIVRVHTKYGG